MLEFFTDDEHVYIDPVKEIDSYRQRARLEEWPRKLIYLPFQFEGTEKCLESVMISHLPPLYPGTKLYLLENQILYCEGLVGAPATVILLEELVALGIEVIMFLGLAGSLQQDVVIGERLLVTGAVRKEGTSYHYLPPECEAKPSSQCFHMLEIHLTGQRIPFHAGKVCSTDAPFRETHSMVNQLRLEGVSAIEMEIAAVYSVCQFRGVKSAALTVISDQLVAEKWTGIKRNKFSNTVLASIRLLHECLSGSGF